MLPEPPKKYQRFIARFPKLGQAWEALHEAGEQGPLDARTQRLVKLAVAVGALREGSVHASARKGMAEGLTEAEMMQVVALAAGTLGMPGAVAAFTWIHDVLDKPA
ncbi:MAG: carboxymuconolactone decarboxylase family protein [Acidobacteria bacterium]|nr:carboxymuconolactone decarboxylase family protein [Acidobacteriota bacterium]